MGYKLTALYSITHSEAEASVWDGEEDEDEERLNELELEELQLREELRQRQEENERIQQTLQERHQEIEEKNQIILKQADEIFSLFTQFVDLVLGEERARFVYQKAAESFQTDICSIRPEESTLQFLRRLTMEFHEQKLRDDEDDEDETDNQVLLDDETVIQRIEMFLTEQERTHLMTIRRR